MITVDIEPNAYAMTHAFSSLIDGARDWEETATHEHRHEMRRDPRGADHAAALDAAMLADYHRRLAVALSHAVGAHRYCLVTSTCHAEAQSKLSINVAFRQYRLAAGLIWESPPFIV